MLKMAEAFISSPLIRKPTVSRKMISAVAVVSEMKSLDAVQLRVAINPAAKAAKKLTAELTIPSPCSPRPRELAANVPASSNTAALTVHASPALSRYLPSGNVLFSPINKKTPPSK